ncbi:MAG: ABC transporter permease [Myxococcota bacterium]|nr:ABC transporter permease [Myxococcota bacterium]
MWNPYLPLSAKTKRISTVVSIFSVILLWSMLSGLKIVGSDKLPAPWEVASAFSQLAWGESIQKRTEERSLRETDLKLEVGASLPLERCNEVCIPIFDEPAPTKIDECEVDWTDKKHPEGILWCQTAVKEKQSLLAEATYWSVSRVFLATLATLLIGLPIGILMGASTRINALLSPLVDPLRSTPIVAVLPILVIWLGIGETMKIAFLVLGAIVFLIPMVRDAMQAVPQTYWISARDLGASELEAVTRAVLPMAMPRIADAIIASVSIMWTYITVAEYVNAERGLGQLIQNAKRFSAMDQVFVGIMVIVALALVTYQSMVWLKQRLYPWESEL